MKTLKWFRRKLATPTDTHQTLPQTPTDTHQTPSQTPTDTHQTPPQTPCALCSAILAAAYWQPSENGQYERRVQLQHPSLKDCEEHIKVLKYLVDKGERLFNTSISAILVQRGDIWEDPEPDFGCVPQPEPNFFDSPESKRLAPGARGGGAVSHLRLQQHQSHPKCVARGIFADWKLVDPEKLKQWKDSCLEVHGERCETPYHIYESSRVIPRWLVDTEQQCLVAGRASMTYVTLSYVWGRKDMLRCVKSNLHLLQQSDALSTYPFVQEIPDTIRDTIRLVPLLGERYLWVDSLCIVQDDEDTKGDELNNMGSIYATSRLTIVVNTTDSWQGLPGISRPRNIQQTVIPFGIYGSLMEGPIAGMAMDRSVESGPYFTRGWCFQEFLLSKRRLIFGEDKQMVRWQCKEQECFEDVVPIDGEDRPWVYDHQRPLWLDRTYPCLGSYKTLVNDYSRKQLSFAQDMLPAFSGIVHLLSHTFHGGFLFGLPELFFDIALGWRAPDPSTRRRTPTPIPFASFETDSNHLPSWSWAGWHGHIEVPDEQDSEFDTTEPSFYLPRSVHTIPITEWYTMESPNSHSRRRIKSYWFRHKLDSQDLSIPLPPGWTRHTVPIDHSTRRFCQRNGAGLYWYSHILIPDKKFFYPLPIPEKSAEPVISPSTPFLFCKTSFGIFYADGVCTKTGWWPMDNPCSLRDSSGNWTGLLFSLSAQDYARFLAHPRPGEEVELVAISRGHCSSDSIPRNWDELRFKEFPNDAPMYEYYTVLWVEWIDGVAHRKGLGRVLREAWERLKKDIDIDLILG